jgi:hypothetical protein
VLLHTASTKKGKRRRSARSPPENWHRNPLRAAGRLQICSN